MKLSYYLLIILLLGGCSYLNNDIELTGTVSWIKNGSVIIKDSDGKTVMGTDIKAGKFHVLNQRLAHPGYYTLHINDFSHFSDAKSYEVYLQQGIYSLALLQHKYPKITSPSQAQTELSAYHLISDSIDRRNNSLHHDADSLLAVFNSAATQRLSPSAYNILLNKLKAAQNKHIKGVSEADKIAALVKKYPNTIIAAHLITQQDYANNPVRFYAVYQMLSTKEKNSDDGREVGDALQHLVRLVPDAAAPPIAGTQPDGKPFNLASLHKKVIIIDFWRSGDSKGRGHHIDMPNIITQMDHKEKVGIISVSFDTHRDYWLQAIKEDKMDWPQISDTKGDDSPNAANWGITTMPTYYVITGEGKVIEGDISFDRIPFVVNDYLAKHP